MNTLFEIENINWEYIYNNLKKDLEVIKYKLKRAEIKQKIDINFSIIYEYELPEKLNNNLSILEKLEYELKNIILKMDEINKNKNKDFEIKFGLLMLDCKDQLEILQSNILHFCYNFKNHNV